MVDWKRYTIGFLIILSSIAASYIYFQDVRIRIDDDKAVFYVKESRWLISALQEDRLYSGTGIVDRVKASIVRENYTENNLIVESRFTRYENGEAILHTWKFDPYTENIEDFPIKEEICIENAKGKYYRYSLKKLYEPGPKRKLIETSASFGRNMKVTFEPDYSWAWIGWPYGKDSFAVQYKIDSDYECFDVRLFDPVLVYTNNFTKVGQSDYVGDVYTIEYDGTYIYAGTWGNGLNVYTFDGTDFTLIDNINLSSNPQCQHIYDIDVDNTTIFVGSVYAVCAFDFNGTDLTLMDNYTTSGVAHGVSLIDWNDTHSLMISDHDTDGLRGYFWNGTNFGPLAFKYETADRTYSSYAYNKTRIFSFDSSAGVKLFNISIGDDNFTLVDTEGTYYDYQGIYDPTNEYLYGGSATNDAYDPVGLVAYDVTDSGITVVTTTLDDLGFNKTTGRPHFDDKFVYSKNHNADVGVVMEYDGATFTLFQNLSLSGVLGYAGNWSDYLFVGNGGLTAWKFNASTDIEPDGIYYAPTNPSFEIGSPFSWTGTGGIGGRSAVVTHLGSYSLKITQTGGANTLVYQNLTNVTANLINGTNYTASAWIYIPTDLPQHDMHGELAMGSDIGSQSTRRTYGSVNTTNDTFDTWMQINLTFTYDNSTWLYFDLFGHGYNGSGAGGFVYWDDAYIFNYTASNASTPAPPGATNQSNGTIFMTPISNYTASLWMIDFSLEGANATAYDNSSCGAIPTSSSANVTAHKIGAYALSYNSERTILGRSDQNRFNLYRFPRRFYANTFRTFFQFNTTLTANSTVQVNVNMTYVLNNTGISSSINSSTARLYRISRNGGIYNDTGLCLENPIAIN